MKNNVSHCLLSMADSIVLRIQIPSQKLQKALKVNLDETIWQLKKNLIDKLPDLQDALNYGLFLHGKEGKQGKFLDERKPASNFNLEPTVILIDIVSG